MTAPIPTTWALSMLGANMLLIIAYFSMIMLAMYIIGYGLIRLFKPIVRFIKK